MTKKSALVVGATGIVGLNLIKHLLSDGDWSVHGLARNPSLPNGAQALQANLLDPESLRTAFQKVKPTHIFLSTWLRQHCFPLKVRRTQPFHSLYLLSLLLAPLPRP